MTGLASISAYADVAESDWEFAISPYFIGATVDGDVATLGSPTTELKVDFDDIFDALDMGAMVIGEARKGDFALMADLIYVKLATKSSPAVTELFDSKKIDSKSFVFTPMLEYRIHDAPDGTHFDIMGGARYWDITTELRFAPGLLPAQDFKDEQTWIDPMIGFRGRYAFSENWDLAGFAMGGGFGFNSGFTWDVFAGLNYQFNDVFSISAGYRVIQTDYDEDGFVYDLLIHGPTAGGVIKF